MTESTLSAVGATAKKGASKLLYTILMLVVLAAILCGVLIAFYKTMNPKVLYFGAPAMLIYSIICFKVKKGFRMWVVWWGILSLLTAAWWGYLIVASRR